jgi:polyisoprenoid-binding protein YceI
MTRLKRLSNSALILCLGLPVLAQAQSVNTIDIARSAITFVATQMGVPAEGSFKRFAARVEFDPARLPASQTRIEIELDSFESGVTELDTEVRRKAWFNTAQFPIATFVSTALRSLGPRRYEATGKMTIKGRTREVTVPFAVRQDGSAAVFEGAFVLKRLDYGIGEGPWADTETVADEVRIGFKLTGTSRK